MNPITVSPARAAELLDVSRDHIYDLINSGQLDAAKSGSRTLIGYQSLIDYFERNKAS